MAEEIKPTRSELIKLKNRIKLVKAGYNLLKKKRDGLILEFFEILKESKEKAATLHESYSRAQHKLNMARILQSDLAIKAASFAVGKVPAIEVTQKNIVGVRVPRIKGESVRKKFFERGYSLYEPVAIDEAADAYEKLVEEIIAVAEIEITLRKLLAEIEKTKRRVNALEFEVIPSLERMKNLISFRLEEMERENFTRLKLIKARLQG